MLGSPILTGDVADTFVVWPIHAIEGADFTKGRTVHCAYRCITISNDGFFGC